ncbi:MAG: hypothetical protein ABIH23_34130 [bacterium]
MVARLAVPDPLNEEIQKFINENDMALEIVDRAPYDLRVVVSGEQRQSIDDNLEASGWITCGHALQLAKQLGIPSLQFGALLDLLEIKVRECSLGCFK